MTGSWGFGSIPVEEIEALDGSLLSQTLLRNRDCHNAEDLGKRGKSQEQETQDYWLNLSSCYSVWAGHHKNQCHNKQCRVTTGPLLLGIFKVEARHLLENTAIQKLIGGHPNDWRNFKDYVEDGLLNLVCSGLKATPTASEGPVLHLVMSGWTKVADWDCC